jgi:hypothetical protein
MNELLDLIQVSVFLGNQTLDYLFLRVEKNLVSLEMNNEFFKL